MDWQEYAEQLRGSHLSPKDITFLEPVFRFAEKIHESELRLSGEPYFTHPIAVSLKLAGLKLDAATVAAGLLHDVAERSPEALKLIRKNFGQEVAFLVDGVTKVDRVEARGAERALESVRKMFLAVAEDIRVVIIKLMDRLHNMETLSYLPKEKRERIAKETLSLYAPLAERIGMWNIKAELEDLAFEHLWPGEFKEIGEEIKKRAPEQEARLKKIIPQLQSELAAENVKIEGVHYRAKHLYSAWQKLERYEGDWAHLTDLIAVRVIASDIKNCYAALGVIHKLWKPVPGRFVDYIALPKPNGYQSLHTRVFTDGGVIVEFQIRTPEMHREAEAGIAAHWAYSEAGKPKEGAKVIGKKFNWIGQLHEWHKEFEKDHSDSEELLEALKIDFFKDRIFVLTPKGDVIDLPRGASPLDFAYHIHSEVGDHASGAKVNDRLAPFSRELRSGEVVEIITQKNKRPSVEWLSLVKTSIAKSRIRRALRLSPKQSFLAPAQKPVEIQVYGKSRVGFIKDITSVFARLAINIQTLNANRSGNDEAPIRIIFIPKDKNSVPKIAERLEKIKGVVKIAHKVRT
ncbi:bifunctional (p)ppGpp synthetase/guanosine-3',5'-bis(diphosphate) 3'-pyrophosphohydrolase [Candidatus Giovannonibacteria bacterium]|nr:bifunctional (p)ppGpp synthetase/guanosine-3',5'-bis(diphosphate) 3'-pyrophosphohydrolase [Candidatus Giovannonibacteria bacterium]